MAETSPPIPLDYSSRDYASLRGDLVAAIPAWIPEWTNRSESDFGIVLIEMFAYVGDILNYYIDRAANEAFITTAVQRASVISLAQMLDYRPTGLAGAGVLLSFTASAAIDAPVLVPAGTKVSTIPQRGQDPVIFETVADLYVPIGGTTQVEAVEGETIFEDLTSPVGISTGGSDQVFSLYQPDQIEGSLAVYVDEDADGAQGTLQWREVAHLIDAAAEDRVYTTMTDESGFTYVLFGDDVNGRIPTQGAIITAQYRVGQGSVGNVGAGTLVELTNPITGIESVVNPASASGGSDVESLASIRRKAPRSLTTLERAVTTKDYETLALKVGGVLHARAVAAVYTNVILYISPAGGGVASTALKNDVLNYLDTRRMVNTSVTIGDPTYVPIDVTVFPLRVLPQYNRAAVTTAVENAIAAVLDFENTGFGFRVTQSQIYRAIQGVEGVDFAVVTVLDEAGGTGLDDVVLAENQIPIVGTLTVTATGGLIGS